MSKYRDRGIMKWAPFDALISYQAVLKSMQYERGKQKKPELTDDHYEILNRHVQQAIMMKTPISITYFEDGYFKTIYGTIKRYDDIKKTLIFMEGYHIKINQIMDVNE